MSERTKDMARSALSSLNAGLKRASLALGTARGPEFGEQMREQVLHRARADLNRIQQAKAEKAGPGHDGRPPAFGQKRGTEVRDSKTGEIIRQGEMSTLNLRTDRLEELAHTDEDGKLHVSIDHLKRLNARSDCKREPLIDGLQYRAGRKLQADWEQAKLEPIAQLSGAVAGAGAHQGLADAKCDAFDRVADAFDHVGPKHAQILMAIVIEGRTLDHAAVHLCGYSLNAVRRNNAAQKVVRLLLAHALDCLAAHYWPKSRRERRAALHPYHPVQGER